MIDGTIVKLGAGGGGGGAGQPPPFRVTVPSVDVDWEGFATSGDENGEETRFVIVPLNTNRVDDIRGVKLNDPFDDDERNLRPNFPYGHPVNPDITLHWEAGNELGLARGKNAVNNGTNINARATAWPLYFTVIPKMPALVKLNLAPAGLPGRVTPPTSPRAWRQKSAKSAPGWTKPRRLRDA